MDANSIRDRVSAAERGEILLVEDLDTDARLIRRTLQLAGVGNHLRHFSDGRQAIGHLMQLVQTRGQEPPSALLLDLKLPGLNGFEILQWVQHRREFSKTLKVVLSQLDHIHNIKKAYALGAHSFLSKPVGQEDLH